MLILVLDRRFWILVFDAPPREAEPFTRITRPCRAVRSLPLAPSFVPLIPSLQVCGLYRKERTDHGRQPALILSPSVPIRTLIPNPLPAPCSPLPALIMF